MACIVMTCMVMAYIFMAYIVMACIVLAFIFMAYIVMACIVAAFIVMACIVAAFIVMAARKQPRTSAAELVVTGLEFGALDLTPSATLQGASCRTLSWSSTTVVRCSTDGQTIRYIYSYGLYSYGLYSYGLYSYGLYSYGLYSYGLYSYGLCSDGLYSYGLYSYGLYSDGLYSYGLYSYGSTDGETRSATAASATLVVTVDGAAATLVGALTFDAPVLSPKAMTT